MRLLVIGGTRFYGRATVELALARGHQVTVFHRGKTPAPAGADEVLGDRTAGVEALDGREWDAVLDTCGFLPRHVRESALRLRDRVGTYAFVSSVSVYKDFKAFDQDETAPLATLDAPTEDYMGEAYGALKALCEREARDAMDGRALLIRPGLIVGPNDPTERFTYWARRIAAGGEVLAPAPQDRPVQWIDSRDLAAFTLAMLERGFHGTYNAVAPWSQLTDLLTTCKIASRSDARFTWVDEAWLKAQGVAPWSELPMWIEADELGMARVDASAAYAKGLVCRPTLQTVADTLAWAQATPPTAGGKLTREREAELLRLWAARASS